MVGRVLHNHLCRHCYRLFRFDHVGIVCGSEKCSQVQNDRRQLKPRFFKSRDYGFWKGTFRKRLDLDESTPCPFCEVTGKLEKACPLCRRPLDPTAGEVDDHVIAVIGASDSGKSHYLAAMLHQFLEENIGKDTWSVDFASEEDRDLYLREFWEPLFEQRRELPATPATEGPELRLVLEHRPTGRRTLLAFRDLGGEIFADPAKLEKTRFLRYARGVVLVTDPQAFRVDTLSGVQPWIPNGRPTALKVLENYRRVLASMDRLPELEGLPVLPEDKYLAVAVTKADLVLGNDHPFYTDEPLDALQSGFWTRRREQDASVRTWVQGHFGRRLLEETRHFADSSFFFVSSYGYRHQPRTSLTRPPQPMRVHEPILALLDRMADDAGPSKARGRKRDDDGEDHF